MLPENIFNKVELVSEVYLTRDVEITVYAKKSFSLAGGVKPGTASLPSGFASSNSDEKLKAIADFNKALKTRADPGGYFELTDVNDSSIAMKRIYHFPVVVGFKFLRYKLTERQELVRIDSSGAIGGGTEHPAIVR